MNEIANVCELFGADVDRVRQAVGSDRRIGSSFLFPGVGYGGSCFPKDVKALVRFSADKKYDFKILKAVEAVNELQKRVLVRKMEAHFGSLKGRTIAIWGLAFKPKTDDMREAPAIPIIQALLEKGAKVQAYDPEAMKVARRHLRQEGHLRAEELRRAARRRRAGDRHRVARVPRARLRAHAQADAEPGDLRRPQHLPAAADEGARLHLLLDRDDKRGARSRHRRGGLHRQSRGPRAARRRACRRRARRSVGRPRRGGARRRRRSCRASTHDRATVAADAARARDRRGDALCRLAGRSATRSAIRSPTTRTTSSGSLALLEAMVEAGVKRCVFSSTCAVYGEPSAVPIVETLHDAADQRLRRDEAGDRAGAGARRARARPALDRAALFQRRRRPSRRDDRRGSRIPRST